MIVNLFVTCMVDSQFPEVGECVVELLEQAGFQVVALADSFQSSMLMYQTKCSSEKSRPLNSLVLTL
jgi:Fe-S oxidoreductase